MCWIKKIMPRTGQTFWDRQLCFYVKKLFVSEKTQKNELCHFSIEIYPYQYIIFFDACVPRGGLVGPPPLEMAFLQKKCTNFGPEVKFDKILAIFWGLSQISSTILTI